MLTYSRGAAPNATPRRVTGQYLARAHLSRKQRAQLAADLSNGTLEIVPLTTRQAAMVAGVPERDVTRAWRAKRINGHANGNGHESLARHIARSSAAERLEAARTVGPAEIWDTFIVPACSEEQAATGANPKA